MAHARTEKVSTIDSLYELLYRPPSGDQKKEEVAILTKYAGQQFYVLKATRMLYGTEENGSYPWVCAETYDHFISDLRDWAVKQSSTVVEWEEWEERIRKIRELPPTPHEPYHFYTSPIDVWINWKLWLVQTDITTLLPLIKQKVASSRYSHQQQMADIIARDVGYRELES